MNMGTIAQRSARAIRPLGDGRFDIFLVFSKNKKANIISRVLGRVEFL